jgi:pSer/pThr/pTyr-binding forkhead associated (FHA) protein
MRSQLVSLDDGTVHEIVKDLVVVGRGEDCDLQLGHKSVSKLHCVIVRTEGALMVRDLGSTNGTRVNGERIRRAFLLPNDKVNIANLRFRVVLGPSEPSAAAVPDMDAQTQNISLAEMKDLMRKHGVIGAADEEEDSGLDAPDMSIRQNALPDVYTDPEEKRK